MTVMVDAPPAAGAVDGLYRPGAIREGKVRTADPFVFHCTDGTYQVFDVSDEALAPFHVRFGDRIAYRRGPSADVVHVVVGAREGKQHVARDWCGAFPLEREVDDVVFVRLYRADVQSLSQFMRRFPSNTVERRAVVYQVPMANRLLQRTFDVSFEASAPFGVFPGQLVMHTSGPQTRQHATILGVHHGKLYRVIQGDRFATPFDDPPDVFRRRLTFKLVSWTRPKFVTDLTVEASKELAARMSRFRYTSFTGPVFFFDTRHAACRMVFGVSPGDRVLLRKGDSRSVGKHAVIVGVSEGLLWKVDDGARVATVFQGCHNAVDLEREFSLQIVGHVALQEHTG